MLEEGFYVLLVDYVGFEEGAAWVKKGGYRAIGRASSRARC